MSRTQLSLFLASSLVAATLVACGAREPAEQVRSASRPMPVIDARDDAAPTATTTTDATVEAEIAAAPAPEPAPMIAGETRKSEKKADGRSAGLGAGPSTTLSHGPAAPPLREEIAIVDRLVALGYAAAGADAPAEPVVNEGGYRDYGVNGFDSTAVDHLSTFAIDVDTASYTMARKNLESGYLPPAGAVRVEEFVNYFPYEYARPEANQPFTVDFEASPSPWDERLTVVRVGVQGRQVTSTDRKPVHLTFLVDTSGSMRSSDKIELVKQSLEMLTRELEDGDTVALATYAGNTKVVLPPTPIAKKDKIIASLRHLDAGGSTAMASGIQLAYGLADETFKPGSVNRVIVCSDGDANVGNTDPDSLAKEIRKYAEKGITLTTLGFGNGNYQDTMMERLANQGDGNYFYIDSDREARRVLVDKLAGTLEVIAKDVKIQVDFDPDVVEAYRLIGYENRDVADRDFRNDKVDAGEIGAGHQVTALYEVAVREGADGKLATVRVRHKAPGPDAPAAEGAWTLTTAAIRPEFDEASSQFRIAAAAGYFAEVLRNSPHVREISLSQVAEIAARAQRVEYDEDRELVRLIRTAARLRGEGAVTVR